MYKYRFLLFLVILHVAVFVNASEYLTVSGIKYLVSSGNGINTAKVVGNNYSGDVVVPNYAIDSETNTNYKVIEVDEYAFYSCPNLNTVTLGDSIIYIYANAFAYSENLTSVIVSSKLQSIGNYAFKNCKKLLSINIPSTVINLGYAVFSGCESLTSIEVGSANPLYSDSNGILYNKTKTNLMNCPAGKSGSVVVPSTVETISSEAFNGCKNISTIQLPNSVKQIGSSAFYNCTSLTSIDLGESVDYIDSYAFYNCSTLMFVNLPEPLISIRNNTFENCVSMESVDFGSKLLSIGEKAFKNCKNINALILPEKVERIDYLAFASCSDLSTIALSDSLKTLSNNVFDGCSSLTAFSISPDNRYFTTQNGILYSKGLLDLIRCPSGKTGVVVIPESVKLLFSYSFYECPGLTSVTLPASLNSIGMGGYAFYGCTGLTSIHSRRVEPCDLFSSAQPFGLVNKVTCTLYMPTGSLTTYRNTSKWSDFFYIVEENVSALMQSEQSELDMSCTDKTLTIRGLVPNARVSVYNLDGKTIFSGTATNQTLEVKLPATGIYFVRSGELLLKVVAQ
jgi:hypothetical protein